MANCFNPLCADKFLVLSAHSMQSTGMLLGTFLGFFEHIYTITLSFYVMFVH
jgi:hypothetical protein